MENPLIVLIVEDLETDALLIEYELRRGGYHPVSQRVATAREMERELEQRRWDVVICDYNLPGFGALEALELIKGRNLDIPFLIVSGNIGEETAVAMMKAGAHDYLMKGNLARLVPAVARELREAGERRERRKAEEQLRENEARFRLLFEDSPISLWENDFSQIQCFFDHLRRSGVADFDRHFREHPEAVPACLQMIRVISVNKATLRMFNAEDQASLQTNLQRTFTDQSLQAFRRELVALSRGETSFSIEGERRTLDGEIFFVNRRLQVAPGFEESLGKVVVSLLDITERKRAQEALQHALVKAENARDKIDAMLKSIANGLLVIDMTGGILLMNRSAERTLGVTLQDTLNHPFPDVLSQESLINHVGRFLAGGKTEEFRELEMFDCGIGEMRLIQTRSSMVQSREGVKSGVVITFIDITREREIDRMKSEFIKTAAHELRTPLTTVMGYAELLLSREPIDSVQQREFLACILEEAENLERIVDDLFHLSRIENGRVMELRRTQCDLHNTIEHCAELYRRECRDHRFETALPPEPAFLYMDCERIGRVLENLVGNAVKYSPKGGLVSIGAEVQGEYYVIRIKDQGIGMTPAQKARAFERFYRADATDTAIGGLGVGMTISKDIVEEHGGEIWIDSEPGKGTVVSFSIPINPPGDRDHPPNHRPCV